MFRKQIRALMQTKKTFDLFLENSYSEMRQYTVGTG